MSGSLTLAYIQSGCCERLGREDGGEAKVSEISIQYHLSWISGLVIHLKYMTLEERTRRTRPEKEDGGVNL